MPSNIQLVLEKMSPDVSNIVITDDNIDKNNVSSVKGIFTAHSLSMGFTEQSSGNMISLSFVLTFSFTIKDKKARNKINQLLLSFNKSVPGIKSYISQQNKEIYSITFTHEAIFSSENSDNVRTSISNTIIPILSYCPLMFSNELTNSKIEHNNIVRA
ncbi:hypothetical protein [Aeromonas eucrenophila]|uniref:Uncharacterized protein n=1 Tax=Aeromonas eucrenophila TaxID=649 RepID=A0ABW0Y6Y8_9GAMM|nr:hypothetical protein [Aeromonas eucrenophila]